MYVLMFFVKVKKHVFLCFLNLQINVFNIYGLNTFV